MFKNIIFPMCYLESNNRQEAKLQIVQYYLKLFVCTQLSLYREMTFTQYVKYTYGYIENFSSQLVRPMLRRFADRYPSSEMITHLQIHTTASQWLRLRITMSLTNPKYRKQKFKMKLPFNFSRSFENIFNVML